MTTPAQRNLARWLLTEESSDRRDREAVSTAAERVCQKLARRLVDIVTPTGSRVLLSRALYLARLEYPFLSGVLLGAEPGFSLDGLHESVEDVEPAQMRAGLAEIVAGIVGLLVTFIGEDLTTRLVRDVWPEAPFDEQGSARREA